MSDKVLAGIESLKERDYGAIARALRHFSDPHLQNVVVIIFVMISIYCERDVAELDAQTNINSFGLDSQDIKELIWDMEGLFNMDIPECDVDIETGYPYLSICHLIEIVRLAKVRRKE